MHLRPKARLVTYDISKIARPLTTFLSLPAGAIYSYLITPGEDHFQGGGKGSECPELGPCKVCGCGRALRTENLQAGPPIPGTGNSGNTKTSAKNLDIGVSAVTQGVCPWVLGPHSLRAEMLESHLNWEWRDEAGLQQVDPQRGPGMRSEL